MLAVGAVGAGSSGGLAARPRAPVSAATVPDPEAARAGHLAIGPLTRDVSGLRERHEATSEGADGGGAPKGCVKSLQPSRTTAAAAICASHPLATTTLPHARVALAHDPRTPTRARRRAAATDPAQARRHTGTPPTRPLPRPPPTRAPGRDTELRRGRPQRSQQHDLRAPPQAVAVLLGLVHDQARGLQVIQPALHAAAMCAHKPRPLQRIARHPAPAHHRRQTRHQLPDRRRVPRRALRVPEAEQVPLDRVRARFQPIVTRRLAAARSSCPAEQGIDDQAPGLGRQRLRRRAIPTTPRPTSGKKGGALQRHRQRPKAPRQHEAPRARADARGTAGKQRTSRGDSAQRARRTDPVRWGWRSVRSAATVREGIYVGSSRSDV